MPRIKSPPTNSPAGFALVSLTPPQGGSGWLAFYKGGMKSPLSWAGSIRRITKSGVFQQPLVRGYKKAMHSRRAGAVEKPVSNPGVSITYRGVNFKTLEGSNPTFSGFFINPGWVGIESRICPHLRGRGFTDVRVSYGSLSSCGRERAVSVPGYPARGRRESQAPGFERAFGRCGCRPGIRVRPDHCSGGVR